jgi:hypothetical protein
MLQQGPQQVGMLAQSTPLTLRDAGAIHSADAPLKGMLVQSTLLTLPLAPRGATAGGDATAAVSLSAISRSGGCLRGGA